MKKIRISAVSYTNSIPFVYGIEHSDILDKIHLSLDIPSQCAQKLIDDEADIGLVPVAALLNIPGYAILGDYCIGANGAVNSVFIFSNKPVDEIKTLRLDLQSRSSNALAKVLLKHFWKVEPEFTTADNADAFVEIGDRTFGKADNYPFVYDLAEQWKNFTGLPFAFAVWASNKPISPEFVTEFNAALKLGVQNTDAVLKTIPTRHNFDFEHYLKRNLDFNLDGAKREAIALFLNYVQDIQLVQTQ